jgi:hypothetical protein
MDTGFMCGSRVFCLQTVRTKVQRRQKICKCVFTLFHHKRFPGPEVYMYTLHVSVTVNYNFSDAGIFRHTLSKFLEGNFYIQAVHY